VKPSNGQSFRDATRLRSIVTTAKNFRRIGVTRWSNFAAEFHGASRANDKVVHKTKPRAMTSRAAGLEE